jgi:hypothetical protein
MADEKHTWCSSVFVGHFEISIAGFKVVGCRPHQKDFRGPKCLSAPPPPNKALSGIPPLIGYGTCSSNLGWKVRFF